MKRQAAALLALAAAGAQATEPFVRGRQQAIGAAQQGRPFGQAVWARDCVHCRDDLALLGRLRKQYPALRVILVATDPAEQREQAEQVLALFQLADAPSWLFADRFVERLRFEIDPQWFGELPRTYFYGADDMRTAVCGKLDARDVEQWVKTSALPALTP